jgi:predicted small lipoprotein YifL
MKHAFQTLFVLLVAWGMAACGQGGGSSEAPAPAATMEQPAAEGGMDASAVVEAEAAEMAAEAADAAADAAAAAEDAADEAVEAAAAAEDAADVAEEAAEDAMEAATTH